MNEREIKSTDDARVVNNSTRQQYRVLTDAEKALVDEIKTKGADFIALMQKIGPSRDCSLAITHMEDAVMRGVRHVTQ